MEIMDYFKSYSSLLEYEPDLNIYKFQMINIEDELIYKELITFIKNNNLTKILISLSGGVDSNVMFEVIDYIKKVKMEDFDIHICHINYNNREESNDEKNFLIEYCKSKNYTLDFKDLEFKRGDIKREEYEKQSKNERYQFYFNLINEYKLDGVFLGHHEDDLVENIFNNIMRGNRSITDLTVLKDKNKILNVDIFRPLLKLRKNIIYDFAHKYQIPYFLDTTPEWSCRGKMRNKIFPICNESYTDKFKESLLKIGKESDELSNIINKQIIEPIIENTRLIDKKISINKNNLLKEKYLLKTVLFKISNKYMLDIIKNKVIDLIIYNFDTNLKLIISKSMSLNITENSLIINVQ